MAIIDPATGGRLTFLDSGEDDVLVVEWAVPAGWTAGPSHRHPGQAETSGRWQGSSKHGYEDEFNGSQRATRSS